MIAKSMPNHIGFMIMSAGKTVSINMPKDIPPKVT